MHARHLEIAGYSSFPYARAPETKLEQRAKPFNWSFKNGRGCPPKAPTFADVLRIIVADVARCPAFAAPRVLVPIPRSGSSRTSFDPDGYTWPCEQLAHAIAEAGGDHAPTLLLERGTRVRRSSDEPERVSVAEHVASLRVRVDPQHRSTPLVLLDDLLVKGTQTIACVLALRAAGYTGSIEAYFVHQAVAPHPTSEQRRRGQVHRIVWTDGERLARRSDVKRWP